MELFYKEKNRALSTALRKSYSELLCSARNLGLGGCFAVIEPSPLLVQAIVSCIPLSRVAVQWLFPSLLYCGSRATESEIHFYYETGSRDIVSFKKINSCCLFKCPRNSHCTNMHLIFVLHRKE